jgi:peptidoglycan-N-acetylglucosamine deacetylase
VPASKPASSLSLDLDNKWSYMKTHGDAGWRDYPSYLDVAVPRILDFLRERNLTISFFIVGQDAALEKNRAPLRALADAGHEIGNHSFRHEPWLHLYSEKELDEELSLAEQHIERATGVRPVGFRGPGFSLSDGTLRTLAKRGYLYDATVFPNALNPLARWYFFATSNLSAAEKEQRKALFGTFADAFRPIKPFRWQVADSRLLEIPVTTMPWFRVPIHLSYVLYLSRFSRLAARAYFRFAIAMCRLGGVEPSILLHPLDFLGVEDRVGLEFFPGMDLPVERKLSLVDDCLKVLTRHYEPVTMRAHADRLTAGRTLATLEAGA